MSASLIALIPLVLLALVGTLCFIGCVLQSGGIPLPPGPLGPYEGDTVLAEASVVALWPLSDPTGSKKAADIGPNKFDGDYVGSEGNDYVLQQPGLVPQDIINGAQQKCVYFGGGSVQVGFQQALNPGSFTVEAWVKPNWTAADAQVVRAVVASINTPAGAGYALFATQDNFWSAQIGIGSGNVATIKFDEGIVLPDVNAFNITYLAVTFNNITGVLKLYVGPSDRPLIEKVSPALTPPATFLPEQSKPPVTQTSLFIGLGRPDMAPAGMFPFLGNIQDVAVYSSALDFDTLKQHFNAGTNAG
jgi:hypothetical protein